MRVVSIGRGSRVRKLAAGLAAAGLCASALGLLIVNKLRDDDYVSGIRRSLEHARERDGVFTEEMVAGLPEPARRYFLHAIQPGTPLASRLHWRYSGSLRPNERMPWLSLRADQILVKERGFVWRARAWKGPLLLTASDHYQDGRGRMRIALFGLIPIINATGPDVSKSALARLLVEGIALPSMLLPGPHVQIDPVDDTHFAAKIHLYGETTPVTIAVDSEGQPREVTLPRWGNATDDQTYRYIPYGATITEGRAFGGYTIPTRITAGWWYGTERYQDAIRISVEWAYIN